MSSAYFKLAARQRAIAREHFEDYKLMAYERASEAVRGALLNERGRRAGIDSYSLFEGTEARAMAYASEELREHWAEVRRPTFEWYEQEHADQWFYGRE